MNRFQRQIEEFHRLFEHPVNSFKTPSPIHPDRVELRTKLIRSEAKETCDAIEAGDLVETIDGICDLIYVTVGAAVEMGVDVSLFFDEVHRTNMLKKGGGKDADGKTLKPPGWLPPDIYNLVTVQVKRELIPDPLTEREREIMLLLVTGWPNQDIAAQLKISVKTVDTHRGKILKKTSCGNNVKLVYWAAKNGYLAL